jgi:hypothetical protein
MLRKRLFSRGFQDWGRLGFLRIYGKGCRMGTNFSYSPDVSAGVGRFGFAGEHFLGVDLFDPPDAPF